jgi:hypothetical protein
MKKQEMYQQDGVAMTCRSYAEYEAMFSLKKYPIPKGPILDIAGGASSFAAEARVRGEDVFCVDPMYHQDADALDREGAAEIERSTEKLEQLQHMFHWEYYGSPTLHKHGRKINLQRFVTDYREQQLRSTGRYVNASLPQLPFESETFSAVFCSHFLFLYELQFDYTFHLQSIMEMIRLLQPQGEIRIYPLLNLKFEPYEHLDRLILALQDGCQVDCTLLPSELPFIPHSDRLLSIKKS